MTAIAGYRGAVYVTSSPSVVLTQFVLTDSGDHKTFTTPGAQQAKRYWDKTVVWLVETTINGGTSWSTATVGTYTIQYVGGIVTLVTPLTGTPGCRVTGAYFAYSQLGDGKSWDVSIDSAVLDVSVFTSQWHTLIDGMNTATGTIAKFYNDGTFLSMLGALMIIVLFTDALVGPAPAGPRYEGYGYIKQDQLKVDVKAAVEESLPFEIDGQLYYLAN
jgi:hypothetical protein